MKFVLKEGAEKVIFTGTMEEHASGFDVKAYQILKAFKGDTEITGSKLQKMKDGFNERGYIKLRPFERIVFDIGFTIDLNENPLNPGVTTTMDVKLSILNSIDLATEKGLFITPGIIDGQQDILRIMVYNSTPFLNKIEKNQKIAKLIPIFVSTGEYPEGW